MKSLKKFKFSERFADDNFLKVTSISDYTAKYKPDVTIPHTHNYYLLMLITAGTGLHFIDFKEYPIKKNALYLITPGQVHSMLRDEENEGYDIIFEDYFFCIGADSDSTVLEPPFFRNGLTSPFLDLEENDATYIEALMKRMQSEYEGNLPAKWEVLRGLLRILIDKCEKISNRISFKDEAKINRPFSIVHDFRLLVEKYYKENKQVSFYAQKLNISSNHLTETIREITKETPIENIRRRTILEAKRLLLENDESVKEISFQLGYESTSYFIKVFRTETGLTPSEFRSKILRS